MSYTEKPVSDASRFRTENSGEWPFDPYGLMSDLVSGEVRFDDEYLQSTMMDWLQSKDYNLFRNLKDGTEIYSQVCKRGNKVYTTRKSVKMDEMIERLNEREFDFPIGSTGLYRMCRIFFVTVNFDKSRFTKEEAWAFLRSTSIEGTEHKFGAINRLDANLSKILGTHGKLVCRESQEDGYPAPHMLLILDKHVRVKLHKGRSGSSWRIEDPIILRRLGKDPAMRNLGFKNYKQATKLSPVWKHGFFDIQGVVRGSELKKHRNAFTYLFKYLIKYLNTDKYPELKEMRSFEDTDNKGLKTTLYTHLCNKCFRTRDISYGKGFKERLGLLPAVKSSTEESIWKRIETVPDFIYERIREQAETLNAKKLLEAFLTPG